MASQTSIYSGQKKKVNGPRGAKYFSLVEGDIDLPTFMPDFIVIGL